MADGSHPSPRQQRLEEAVAEYVAAESAGAAPDRGQWLAAYPDIATELAAFLAERVKGTQLFSRDTIGHEGSRKELRPLSLRGNDEATLADFPAGDMGKGTLAPPAAPRWRFGDYEILDEIARGGMGVVYKARQVSLNRTVALKMILTGQLASDEDVKRFYTEAKAAANLDHPGIVPVFEVGQHELQHYFAMGYVEGSSLAERVASGPLAPSEAAALTRQVAEAVAYAHNCGVIHRDLKPANVLLDKSGHVRITDFGLAKRVASESQLTSAGHILGTPSYMPPEQAAGQSDRIGPRSDVYSIGAMLYELLTGRPPFRGVSPIDTITQVLDASPAPPRLLNAGVPRDLETICLKCLEKEPSLRYATAQQLGDDLQRFLQGDPIVASTVNLLSRVARALSHSRFEEQFQGWGISLMALGVVVFLSHAWMYFMVSAGYGAAWSYWAPRAVMAAAIAGLIWRARPRSLLPTSAAERPIWGIWIGYVIAVVVTYLVIYTKGGHTDESYPFTAVLSGLAFFAMGSHIWGGCYAIGLCFTAAAPWLALRPDQAVFWFGMLWLAALLTLGLRYWWLGRRRNRANNSLAAANAIERAAESREGTTNV